MRRMGEERSLKILPMAEVAAKDEFLGIKTATRDDVPPALLGFVPAQGTMPGNSLQSIAMFVVLEIQALQARFLRLNEDAGREFTVAETP